MFKCHGIDSKGKECGNSVGLFRYFFLGLCLECEIKRDEMAIKEKKARLKRMQRYGK